MTTDTQPADADRKPVWFASDLPHIEIRGSQVLGGAMDGQPLIFLRGPGVPWFGITHEILRELTDAMFVVANDGGHVVLAAPAGTED